MPSRSWTDSTTSPHDTTRFELLRAANRARANRVGSVIDRRMSATLARAVRHAFASSRGEGMKVVYERIDTLLIDDRLTVAVDMLTAADSSLDRLASEDDEVLQDRAVLATTWPG